jgi:hypothetical protein
VLCGSFKWLSDSCARLLVAADSSGGSGNTGRAGWLGYISGELGDDWPVTELEGALTCLAGEALRIGQLTLPVVDRRREDGLLTSAENVVALKSFRS